MIEETSLLQKEKDKFMSYENVYVQSMVLIYYKI